MRCSWCRRGTSWPWLLGWSVPDRVDLANGFSDVPRPSPPIWRDQHDTGANVVQGAIGTGDRASARNEVHHLGVAATSRFESTGRAFPDAASTVDVLMENPDRFYGRALDGFTGPEDLQFERFGRRRQSDYFALGSHGATTCGAPSAAIRGPTSRPSSSRLRR